MSLLDHYQPGTFFDEMARSEVDIRSALPALRGAVRRRLEREEFEAKRRAVDLAFLRQGITFNVYGDQQGTERIFPFDLIPRIIPAAEWEHLERGLEQRITALNLFLHDIYHEQRIMKEGVVPPFYVLSAKHFRREFVNFHVPKDIYVHICGTDLIRDKDGNYLVLEDNCRCPSGVSYVLENRRAMKRSFPGMFESVGVRPVDSYSTDLLKTLAVPRARRRRRPDGRPAHAGRLQLRLLRAHLPGAADGHRDRGRAATSSCGTRACSCAPPRALQPVHVIYRRIDDDFLDPTVFRKDSDARRPRPDQRLPGGKCRAGEFHRHRRGGRQGGLLFRAEDHQVLPRPGADPAERADLPRLRGSRT